MMTNNIYIPPASASTGQSFTDNAHLDRHFLACQPEYEAMLKSIGLQKGWHVLDAGCGSGSFLPLMSQLVGETGAIYAIDLTPENVALVESAQVQGDYACNVVARIGKVTELPYEDNSFDAIWCAAVSQYLDDDQLTIMLSEFRRVLKPGGLMALRDVHLNTWEWQPLDPLFVSRTWVAGIASGSVRARQGVRGVALPAFVRRAGFKNSCANTIMIQRWQPLSEAELAYQQTFLSDAASVIKSYKYLSNEDRAVWEMIEDASSPNHILNHPDFYFCEGHMLIVAENP